MCFRSVAVLLLYAAVSSAAVLETGTQGPQSRVRLANSVSQTRGRLEVLVEDVWGTVCGNGFDAKAARVVCHELGYSGGTVYYRAKYGEGDGPIWLTDVNCSGSEKSLFDCEFVVNDTKKCAHYHDVSVACIETPGEGDVQLKDGHLEIYHEGQWGTVCDDHFDENALTVLCRQLGYSHGHFRSDSTVGNGTIWLDDIRCLGHETKLTQCSHKAWGHHDCLHSEDVRLGCERSEGDVRLVDGESAYEGRVEIYKNGAWLALCSENLDADAASVICSKQGHMEYISIWNDTHTPSVNGTFQLDASPCGSQEDHLSECLMIGRPVNNCDGNRVAGLTCSPKPSDGALRLVGSERALEIYHEHTWGRLCADSFDSTMAKIACRQMGYSGGTTKREDESYYGDMWKLKNVLCEGYESELIDCSHNGWDTCKRYSYGSRGISLTCDRHRNGLIRLVNGEEPFEGRLEVYFNGEWGTVCDDDFDDNDAEVVCRQLGYNYGEILQAGSHGQGLSSIAMDDVDCSGHELKLNKCAYRGLGEHNCKHEEDVSIRCKLPGGGNLRLIGRTWAYKGVVEIFDRRTEEWVPVSFRSADSKTASVVCRELGYRGGDLTRANRNRDDRSSRFDMDIVCSGYENTLKHCAHDTSGDSSRSNRHVVTVVCDLPENGDVRLTDGRSSYDGRIEVYHDSKWRKLCTQDDHTALVACRQLGYTLSEVQEKDFPTAKSKPALPYTVRCSGHENALTQCIKHFEENPKLMCHGIKDMYVQCQHGSRQEDGDLRLVNGNSPNEGRLEIYHSNQWGSVCDDGFTQKNVDVVCRQLGYLPGIFKSRAAFGEGNSRIWLDDVHCTGLEEKFSSCSHEQWGTHDCEHFEDVSVLCLIQNEHDIRLVGERSVHEGRLEILHNRQWGTVCDDKFGNKDASTACRQLGYSGGTTLSKAHFSEGVGVIWLDEVECVNGQTNLAECDHAAWGEHDCEHDEDVGIECSDP